MFGGTVRQTLVVEGSLAYRTQRAAAASAGAIGREILTMPQLAARLAGGFVEAAGVDIVFPAIGNALASGGFVDLHLVAQLPGTARAVLESLTKVWNADLDLAALAPGNRRLTDLAVIETRIREALPSAWLLPRDLRDVARTRVAHAPRIFGHIILDSITDIEPVWRPLLVALSGALPVEWRSVGDLDRTWFPGHITPIETCAPRIDMAQSCADLRSEVVEALRWARERLSVGGMPAAEVAISSTTPHLYDEYMLVLRQDSGLPIHFAHGVPALSSRDGQCCAALADILTRGLNQRRVRRLLLSLPGSPATHLIPKDWLRGLRSEAGLFSVGQWEVALREARDLREHGDKAERVLLPILSRLASGPADASQVGELLLSGRSLSIWRQALRMAPSVAVSLSLSQLRVPDETDAANSIAWCSSDQLSASPRPIVRLIGLNVGSWPRGDRDNTLIPNHVLPRRKLQERSLTDKDRTSFAAIVCRARHVALSMSRRSGRGGLHTASPLWPKSLESELLRHREPAHAFSENDRLLARRMEAKDDIRVLHSRACWTAWASPELTEHDGIIASNHRIVRKAVERVHSATSLRLLLRDAQAFVWAYAMGWWADRLEPRPLELDAAAFGELVHEIIAQGIRMMDAQSGVQRASSTEMAGALATAAAQITETWPSLRAVPPQVIWKGTVAVAQRLATHALEVDAALPQSIRSWTELSFGKLPAMPDAPWNGEDAVVLPDTGIRVHGRIDRLDLADNRIATRITDYKTSHKPEEVFRLVIGGGRELQRVLYAAAAKQLLPDVQRVTARLIYLRDDAFEHPLTGDELDHAIAELSKFARVALDGIVEGKALPGPDALDKYSKFRLALPADRERYFATKREALKAAQGKLNRHWNSD